MRFMNDLWFKGLRKEVLIYTIETAWDLELTSRVTSRKTLHLCKFRYPFPIAKNHS